MSIETPTILETTVSDVHAQMKAGELSCIQLVNGYLDRIRRYDRQGPELHAIVNVNTQALESAGELDRHLAHTGVLKGPLHGVPVLVKDQAETSFAPTTFGNRAYAKYQPGTDAFVVARLIEAGAVILAKTSMCDFAAGWFSFSSITGRTRNPYALERDAGGSSAGTAAGLAANFGLVGVGEDTGGSIRIPASFNNLFGLRVTTGLISRSGFAPLLHCQDTPGPMARTVRDLAKLLDVMIAYDPNDPYTAAVAQTRDAGRYERMLDGACLDGLRIGVLQEGFGSEDASSAEVNAVVHRSLEQMREAGAQTIDVRIPSLRDRISRTSLYVQQSKADLNRFMAGRANGPSCSFEQIYASACFHPQNDLFHSLAAGPSEPDPAVYLPQRLAQIEFQRVLLNLYAAHDLDVLMYPDVQVLPPTYRELEAGKWSCLNFPTNTVIASQSHLPALSMPAGFSSGRVPIGVEVVGKPFAELALLRFAYAWEKIARPRSPPDMDGAP